MAQDQKRLSIIEAAQKRFAHFGVSKTTMTEIADDLGLSKASLYYYFPDKLNLYAAVLQHIIEKEDIAGKSYMSEKDPLTVIFHYLDDRTAFVNKYYNILEHLNTLNIDPPKELRPVFNMVRTRQVGFIRALLISGVASGKLKVENPQEAAEIFMEALDGLRINVFEQKHFFDINKKLYQSLLKREKSFATIFFGGLYKK